MSTKHSTAEPTTDSKISMAAVETANPKNEFDEADIARLAYEHWMDGGCQEGTAEDDWLRAESELREAKNKPASMAAAASGGASAAA